MTVSAIKGVDFSPHKEEMVSSRKSAGMAVSAAEQSVNQKRTQAHVVRKEAGQAS